MDDVDRVLGEHGLKKDSPEARQQFERRLEARRLEMGDSGALAPGDHDLCQTDRRAFTWERPEVQVSASTRL